MGEMSYPGQEKDRSFRTEPIPSYYNTPVAHTHSGKKASDVMRTCGSRGGDRGERRTTAFIGGDGGSAYREHLAERKVGERHVLRQTFSSYFFST